MEVAMPMTGNAIDSYEDMFKEITRKLYGEDGLPELPANERNHASASDRGLTPIDYDIDTPILKPEEHLTAFGLAALMQNGFPSPFQQHKPNPNFEDKWIISEDHIPWTQSKIASYNPAQKLFRCAECDCVGYLPRVAEHWLGTHSNLRVFQCPQCPYESAWARCVRMHLTRQHNIDTEETTDALLKNNPVLQEVTRYLQRLKTRLESTCHKPQSTSSTEEFPASSNTTHTNTNSNNRQPPVSSPPETPTGAGSAGNKRYTCSYCPYATDRRDLFTRHENIHREEKPFQCYVCQKQFNRADHVKKHFLRMHREHVYDLNRIRRHPPKNASGMSYYQKYNNTTSNGEHGSEHHTAPGVSNPISIPNSFNNISRTIANVARNVDAVPTKPTKSSSKGGSSKKKGEKRFSCCYCSWSGVDNWCLKRHMNTHLKPFVCGLCDYKAARSERLATHVLKVHNKRACSKCTFMADDQQQLTTHQAEHHPMEQRRSNNSSAANNVLRNTSFANSTVTSGGNFGSSQSLKSQDLAAAALLHGQRLLHAPPPDIKPWKPHIPKQHGAARLFNYMEASDGSEPECDSSCGAEDMSRLSHRVQSDFLEAGDVGGGHHTPDEEAAEDEPELPLFVCDACGCEFEDDASLATHRWTHAPSTASPARPSTHKRNGKQTNPEKENHHPDNSATTKYQCKYDYCNMSFSTQADVIRHMAVHTSQNGGCHVETEEEKPPRKRVPESTLATTTTTRQKYFCVKCPKVRKFNHYHNLFLHKLHNHSKHTPVSCEHCNMTFDHKYQMIIHASKAHLNYDKDDTPHVPVSTHEDIMQQSVPMAVPDHTMTPTSLSSSLSTAPSTFTSSASVHKLGMYFDHSAYNTGINNSHMPLIIPTFPPN